MRLVKLTDTGLWHVVNPKQKSRTLCNRPARAVDLQTHAAAEVKPSIGQVCRCCFNRRKLAR